MRLLILFMLSMGITAFARADTWLPDLKLGLNGRTHPVGAQIVGQGGIAAPLWGDTTTWKYGYIRFASNIATSVVVNRVGLEVQVFPISIFGVTAGYDTGARAYTPNYIDCATLQCNGRIDRKYLKSVLVGASHGVVVSMLGRYEELIAPGTEKPFFDEMTLLSGRNYGERILTLNPAVLYTLDDVYRVGFTSLYSRAIDTGGSSNLYGPILSFTQGRNWTGVAGVGLNESALVHSAWTAFFSIQFTIFPSLNVAETPLREKTYSSLF